jgi:hypothetical protein
MSRRVAVGLASTTVLALLAAMMAVTLRLDALRVAPAVGGPVIQDMPSRPIVREVTETITVHRTKKEKAEGAPEVVTVVTTTVPAGSEPAPVEEETGGGPPPESEDGGGDDDKPKPDHDDEDVPGDKF